MMRGLGFLHTIVIIKIKLVMSPLVLMCIFGENTHLIHFMEACHTFHLHFVQICFYVTFLCIYFFAKTKECLLSAETKLSSNTV